MRPYTPEETGSLSLLSVASRKKHGGRWSATMTLLTGDVNADGRVGTADLKEIKMNVGRGLVTEDNFRDDITVDGKVNHGDTSLEKSKL